MGSHLEASTEPPARLPEAGLGRSAGILGLGNTASRLIGLAREAVISGYFGSSGELSAFNLAARVPAMIYDLLVGGMLSAALVPVFTDYTRPDRRDELARVASAVLSLIAIAMGAIVVLIEIFAGPLAHLLGDFDDPALQLVLTRSLRVIAPAVLLFGLSGGITGLLYALQRFSYAALGAAVFNLGIVIAAPIFASRIGVYALAVGVVGGSLLQLLVAIPGLRDMAVHFLVTVRHPAVRRIMRLYLPIALGLVVAQVQIAVDGRWASATGPQSVSWMRYATTLIQLPLGLVPVAVSLAALPGLSRRAAEQDWDGFRRIFGRGLRLVLVLLIPASVGLWVLAGPAIQLLFEHGSFQPVDTTMTTRALRLYLIGLPFAGVDFLFNYTFYARRNTHLPALVGVISVGFYFIVAAALRSPLGYLGLVLADSVKQAAHAGIMAVLMLHSRGRLQRERILSTLARATGAAAAMGAAVWVLAGVVIPRVPPGLIGEVLAVAVPGAVGAGLYLLLLRVLHVPEAAAFTGAVRQRVSRLRPG